MPSMLTILDPATIRLIHFYELSTPPLYFYAMKTLFFIFLIFQVPIHFLKYLFTHTHTHSPLSARLYGVNSQPASVFTLNYC